MKWIIGGFVAWWALTQMKEHDVQVAKTQCGTVPPELLAPDGSYACPSLKAAFDKWKWLPEGRIF